MSTLTGVDNASTMVLEVRTRQVQWLCFIGIEIKGDIVTEVADGASVLLLFYALSILKLVTPLCALRLGDRNMVRGEVLFAADALGIVV